MSDITARLLKINNVDISNICKYEVEYNKLWKDADRNMLGDIRASLIGIFPKIKVETTVQELSHVMTLGPLLNNAYFDVEFYDVITGTTRSARYYASDFTTKLRRRKNGLIDKVSFNLVPVSKR